MTKSQLEAELAALRERELTYRLLLDDSSDPIFCFYRDGTYKYINRAFADYMRMPQEAIIGKRIWDIFSKEEADMRFAAVKWVYENGQTKVIEVRVPTVEGDRFFITTVKPCFDAKDEVFLVICISKDITERKRIEQERERLIEELREAQHNIRTLEGIIPICASCKKIRDDKGAWSQVETYVANHTNAEFSHGICPDCVKELYPEYARQREAEGGDK